LGTIVQLEAIHRTAFDSCLVRLGGGRLTRAGSLTYLETDREMAEATHELALAGIRVTHCARLPAPSEDVRPAIGFDLVPLGAGLQAMDVIELRVIPLSEASARLMHRRVRWLGSSRSARDACRRLLRDDDAVMGWRRIVWCSVASLRAARRRVRLRPVVFDRGAAERRPLRWAYVSAHAIENWAFA
jgi:hypothetical protein